MQHIEKSVFRRGEYVGYGGGAVWHVRRTNSSYGNWWAYPHTGANAETLRNTPMVAHTLRALDAKLAALNPFTGQPRA